MAIAKTPDAETAMYHIISINKTTLAAQKFNAKNEPDKFWEKLPPGRWMSSVYYSSDLHKYDIFRQMSLLLLNLDALNFKYEKYNKPIDFLKQHFIVDGEGHVTRCNQHLIKQQRVSAKVAAASSALLLHTDSGDSIRSRYSSPTSLLRFIKCMFPHHASNQTSNTTPEWALKLIEKLSKSHN